MSQPLHKRRLRLSRRAWVAVAIVVIAFFVVISFFLPHEEDSSTFVGETIVPTVTVTNLVSTLMVNHSADYQNVHFTVTKVSQAMAFSDDRKPAGLYTVRVELQASSASSNQVPIGINYASLVRLVLPGGQAVSPKLVSLAPVILPKGVQTGYMDFPVNNQVDLSSLVLRMGNKTMVAFQ